jgi:tRNA pseudouridine38-40 synthase
MEKDQAVHEARTPPVRLAFRVSYIGSRFYGSQVQEALRTVEGEFIAACGRTGLFSDWRAAGFASAGRTDRGVHARAQVVAFSTAFPDRAAKALNPQLPPDLWCTAYAEVPPEFHPRHDARSRTYRYFYTGRLDREKMDRAARHFSGSHNFSNFARVGDKNPWRNVIAISVGEDAGFVYLEVKAESFLWHQVRCMAAALQQVGAGEQGEDWIAELLEQETIRPIQPAPAERLILWDTECGIAWTPLSTDERSRTYLAELQTHYAVMGQVCRVLGEKDRE